MYPGRFAKKIVNMLQRCNGTLNEYI